MRRLLTAGIFGTILGIVGAYSTANASIVSSGFLDEKLTEYALSTSLDLKANQSDFTELNTQISDSIANLKTLWDESIRELAYAFDPNKVNNNINGAFDLVGGFLYHSMISLTNGWTNSDGEIFRGLIDLNYGWTDSNDGTTYLGVKDLNTKIGSYYWGPENEDYKLTNIPYLEELFPNTSAGKSLASYDMATAILNNYVNTSFPGLAGVTDRLLNGWTDAKGGNLINPGLKGMYDGWTFYDLTFPGLYDLSYDAMRFTETFGATVSSILSNGIDKFTSPVYTGPIYPLWKLSQGIDQIGTLPSGNFPPFLGHEFLFSTFDQPLTYPTSLAELISAIYGDNKKPGRTGLLDAIIAGFPYDSDRDGSFDQYLGLISNYNFTKTVNDIANANEVKIGNDWPFNSDMMPGLYELVYEFYPSEGISLENTSDLAHFLFGGALESGLYANAAGVLNFMGDKIIRVGDYEFLSGKELDGFRSLKQLTNGWTSTDGTTYLGVKELNTKIGTVPDGQTVAGMATTAKTTADSAIEKIGTLPTEYATVGAALSAIKGIAEEAKTAALAAIPDPKTEGATGKYVLTVDIIDSSATPVYRWEKIDREGETTTTTE